MLNCSFFGAHFSSSNFGTHRWSLSPKDSCPRANIGRCLERSSSRSELTRVHVHRATTSVARMHARFKLEAKGLILIRTAPHVHWLPVAPRNLINQQSMTPRRKLSLLVRFPHTSIRNENLTNSEASNQPQGMYFSLSQILLIVTNTTHTRNNTKTN